MKNDPRWMNAELDSICKRCNKNIKKGEAMFYYPTGKTAYCADDGCGMQESRNFEAMVFDLGNF